RQSPHGPPRRERVRTRLRPLDLERDGQQVHQLNAAGRSQNPASCRTTLKGNDMEKFYAFIGIIAALVIGIVFGGYAFSVLWAWFVVALFGAPPLGIAQA